MFRFCVFALLGLAGCVAEPAPLEPLGPDHPAGGADAPWTPPANPLKADPAPPPRPAPAPAHEPHDHGRKAVPYPLDVCLVSAEPLGKMGKPAVLVYEGREIKFCCPACEPTFRKDPAAYLRTLEKPR